MTSMLEKTEAKVTITNELRKEMQVEAIRRLEKIGVMEDVVEEFKNGNLLFSERQNRFFPAGLLDVSSDPELTKVIEKFHQKDIGIVYHAIKNYMEEGGPQYTLLFVTKYKQDWPLDERDLEEKSASAYVSWFEDEIGLVGIDTAMGGIVRTW